MNLPLTAANLSEKIEWKLHSRLTQGTGRNDFLSTGENLMAARKHDFPTDCTTQQSGRSRRAELQLRLGYRGHSRERVRASVKPTDASKRHNRGQVSSLCLCIPLAPLPQERLQLPRRSSIVGTQTHDRAQLVDGTIRIAGLQIGIGQGLPAAGIDPAR